MNISLFILILIAIIGIVTAWIISELKNKKIWIRIIWGFAAILCCWGVAVLAAQIVRLNYNIWYSDATKKLLTVTIESLEKNDKKIALEKLKKIHSQLQPTYERKGNYDKLVREAVKDIKEELKNAAAIENFRIDFITDERLDPIQLENGEYERKKSGNYCSVVCLKEYSCKSNAKPDLYGTVISVNTGGSGCFVYLVLVDKGITIAHKFLGDRIRIKQIYFKDGYLNAEYFVRTAEQAMADVPTVLKHTKLKLDSKNLK